ncbi:hypothetical protein TMatcc_002617 [Talaromyces marneffei ATCC 18224]|uniref:uncharacterized protein n=1 Tax=Talaromyces marneffei TaxID=37727 RepID=UPI0012AA6254|nr:uncharacterized protein EYB26_002277 [Talaromyces marneffei]QGA14621.1 hypothetical protein EYB26_002277 [Talaromyces marneffei]
MASASDNRCRFLSASSSSIASRSSFVRRLADRGANLRAGLVGPPSSSRESDPPLGPMLPPGVLLFRDCNRWTGGRVEGVVDEEATSVEFAGAVSRSPGRLAAPRPAALGGISARGRLNLWLTKLSV